MEIIMHLLSMIGLIVLVLFLIDLGNDNQYSLIMGLFIVGTIAYRTSYFDLFWFSGVIGIIIYTVLFIREKLI